MFYFMALTKYSSVLRLNNLDSGQSFEIVVFSLLQLIDPTSYYCWYQSTEATIIFEWGRNLEYLRLLVANGLRFFDWKKQARRC